jgi:hypothetical protein
METNFTILYCAEILKIRVDEVDSAPGDRKAAHGWVVSSISSNRFNLTAGVRGTRLFGCLDVSSNRQKPDLICMTSAERCGAVK